MNPLNLFVLYVVTATATGAACRSFVGSDQAALKAYGEQLVANKPAEATSVTFMVLPAEGLPA